jgi:hypothetical protein
MRSGRVGPPLSLIVGAVLGGFALSVLTVPAALLGELVPEMTWGIALAFAALGIAAILKPHLLHWLPQRPRQVALATAFKHSAWIYPGLWGFELGIGVRTFLATGGFYVLLAALLIQETPWQTIVVGVTYGGARGLALSVFAVLNRLREERQALPAGFGLKHRLAAPLVLLSGCLVFGSFLLR